MQEIEPQSPETTNIHEKGGLAREHWQRVISRIGQPKAFYTTPSADISGRISSYAHGVESGELTDTEFNHRRFLGRRHWEEIRRLHVGPDAELYSILEQTRTFTLNDYLDGAETSFPTQPVPKAPDDRPWENRLVLTWSPSEGWYYDLPTRYPVDEDSIRSHWLLDKDDVPDPLRNPPDELKAKLIERARLTPELILHRLNVKLAEGRGRFNSFDPWKWISMNRMDFPSYILGDQEIGQYIQKAYEYHFGIKPFVVFTGPGSITVIPTRDDVNEFTKTNPVPSTITEGKLDKENELPTILPSLLEEDMWKDL